MARSATINKAERHLKADSGAIFANIKPYLSLQDLDEGKKWLIG